MNEIIPSASVSLADANRDTPIPAQQPELADADLEAVVAGKQGGFGSRLLWAMYSSSGFAPGSNEYWRTS